jgi:hypothetical protein
LIHSLFLVAKISWVRILNEWYSCYDKYIGTFHVKGKPFKHSESVKVCLLKQKWFYLMTYAKGTMIVYRQLNIETISILSWLNLSFFKSEYIREGHSPWSSVLQNFALDCKVRVIQNSSGFFIFYFYRWFDAAYVDFFNINKDHPRENCLSITVFHMWCFFFQLICGRR